MTVDYLTDLNGDGAYDLVTDDWHQTDDRSFEYENVQVAPEEGEEDSGSLFTVLNYSLTSHSDSVSTSGPAGFQQIQVACFRQVTGIQVVRDARPGGR